MGKHGIDDLVYSKAREVVYEQMKWTATENTFRSRIHEKVELKFSNCLADSITNSTIGSLIGIPAEDRESILEIAERGNSITDNEESLIGKLLYHSVVLDISTIARSLTTLRLVDCGITEIDKSLRQLKNLRLLNLSRNKIVKFSGKFLPRKIRFLELYMNEMEDVRSLTVSLPRSLVHLGMARNKLTDHSGLETLSNNRKSILRSLDLADNDIVNLRKVATDLLPLPLTSIQLQGNPCAMHPSYVRETMACLPRLLYLDGKRLSELEMTENVPLSGGLVFRCHGMTGLDKDDCYYHAELEIPLFDPVRRLSIIEEILHGKERVADVLWFPTEEVAWSDPVNFPDLVVRVPYFAGLTELRDVFRSTVSVRIIKRRMGYESGEVIVEFDVDLQNVSWWMTSLDYKWVTGWKSAVRMTEVKEDEEVHPLQCFLSFAVERSTV